MLRTAPVRHSGESGIPETEGSDRILGARSGDAGPAAFVRQGLAPSPGNVRAKLTSVRHGVRSSYFNRREVRIRRTESATLRRLALRVTIAVSADVTTTDAYSNATRAGMANVRTTVASGPSIEHLFAALLGWMRTEDRGDCFPAMIGQWHRREIRARGEDATFRSVSGPEAT